jgi:type IV secretion system protein VirB3
MSGLRPDPLFLGLTRPVLIAGVHYIMFLMNFMLCGLLYINKVYESQLVGPTLTFAIIHLTLYLLCLKEPRMMELMMTRYGKCSKCKNRLYYKFTNSYDLG